MNRIRFFCGVIIVAFAFHLSATPLRADTWTDKSGQYQIEAEYVGVEGRSVVLRRPDGKTLTVPIDKLSDESRERAKQLYLAAKSNPAGSATTPAQPPSTNANLGVAGGSNSNPAMPPQAGNSAGGSSNSLGFAAPKTNPVAPLPNFPDDPSLQETVDFIREQVLAGHPEVFWYALPNDFRAALDSPEFRQKLVAQIEQQKTAASAAVEGLLMKVIQILATKKDFVLNSQMAASVPTQFMPMVKQGYDPVVGTIYEVAMMSFGTNDLNSMTFTQWLDMRGPRIGGHLQGIVKMLPPMMIDQALSQIQVAQVDPEHGSITIPQQDGGSETIQMVKMDQRWLPEEFAAQWQANRDNIAESLLTSIEQTVEDNSEAQQQAEMMIGGVVGMAGAILDPMLQAQSQNEFDLALVQVMSMAQMFSGAGAGGLGPGGGFGGGDGFGEDNALPPAAPGGFPDFGDAFDGDVQPGDF